MSNQSPTGSGEGEYPDPPFDEQNDRDDARVTPLIQDGNAAAGTAALSVFEVTRIANAAAAETSPDLEVVGVTFGDTDGGYVELLINITGCHADPCRIQLGVFRNAGPDALRAEIMQKLREHRS